MKKLLFLFVLLLAGCRPASPDLGSADAWLGVSLGHFRTEIPAGWVTLESDTVFDVRSSDGASELRFEKTSSALSFHDLFDAGYVTVVERSAGVWVVCADDSWQRCVVQDNAGPELYEFSVMRRGDEEAVRRVVGGLKINPK